MTIRYAKIAMVLALAAYALLVTFSNITDYGANFAFVQHVLSMDTTFQSKAAMYRAITTPELWHAAYWVIIAGEALTGLLLLAGGIQLFKARRASGAGFDQAKTRAVAGITAGFLVWFFCFIVIGSEWFLMWQSQVWNGKDTAFDVNLTLLAVLILVNQPDRDLVGPDART